MKKRGEGVGLSGAIRSHSDKTMLGSSLSINQVTWQNRDLRVSSMIQTACSTISLSGERLLCERLGKKEEREGGGSDRGHPSTDFHLHDTGPNLV